MQKIYNDIIFFVQHHVRIPPSLPHQAGGASSSSAMNMNMNMNMNRVTYHQQYSTANPNAVPILLEAPTVVPSTPGIADAKDQRICMNPNNRKVVEISSSSAQISQLFGLVAGTARASFVDTKLKEMAAASSSPSTSSVTVADQVEGIKSPPKLFGVPLHGRKRLHPQWPDIVEQAEPNSLQVDQYRNITVAPFKALKTDLALNLGPSSA